MLQVMSKYLELCTIVYKIVKKLADCANVICENKHIGVSDILS